MRMVAPRTGAPEITLAENQEEYATLTVAVYQDRRGNELVLSRWRLEPDEIERLKNGEDLYVSLMTFGKPMQPIHVQVGPEGYV